MSEILPGLSMDNQGQVTVDKRMGELLFEFAIELEDTVSSPVDIEHVLAAIVLAVRAGQIDSSTSLITSNVELLATLRRHLRTVFEQHGGKLDCDQSQYE